MKKLGINILAIVFLTSIAAGVNAQIFTSGELYLDKLEAKGTGIVLLKVSDTLNAGNNTCILNGANTIIAQVDRPNNVNRANIDSLKSMQAVANTALVANKKVILTYDSWHGGATNNCFLVGIEIIR